MIFKLLPILMTIVIDAIRHIQEIRKGLKAEEVNKEEIKALIVNALDAIALFKSAPKEYQDIILALADDLITLFVHSYNSTGLWGKKIFIDKEVVI